MDQNIFNDECVIYEDILNILQNDLINNPVIPIQLCFDDEYVQEFIQDTASIEKEKNETSLKEEIKIRFSKVPKCKLKSSLDYGSLTNYF